MISPVEFLTTLKSAGISFFSGVPDSLMKSFLSHLQDEPGHTISPSEGAAIALATGYFLATGKPGLVYFQNSGLGNAVNPLSSLAHKNVYGIPMILLIGWRGQPGKKDEPQHSVMGDITVQLLELMKIPTQVLNNENWQQKINDSVNIAQINRQPVALLVEAEFFQAMGNVIAKEFPVSVFDAISSIYNQLAGDEIVVCTTGYTSRIFHGINQSGKIQKYFLNVGAMGHAGAIGTALAQHSDRQVIVLDGDGSILMHLGSLAIAGTLKSNNLSYFLLNNGVHASVGAQPSLGLEVDFWRIARGCGFDEVHRITNETELADFLKTGLMGQKTFTEIIVNTNAPENLPRPDQDFNAATKRFREAMEGK